MSRRLGARTAGGSVRMGPVSLFALVVALCLAVMAVLAVTTARASMALAERQAAFTADDYANEAVGQELLARVRAVADEGGAGAVGTRLYDLLAACSGEDGPALTATINEGQLSAHIESASGRCLDVVLAIGENGEVSVGSWRATTLWDEDTGDVLWTGQE
ncbi:MAG TPA: hypothetical protein IAA42_02650 [Candidatus Olsenella excrementavium]|uniref:S4A5 electrogenic sodium bicarbonate cotransporter 4 n=1 Tax=Candidatus Olsenella excrementavium TaxID=2838709 RepID=A0A9D2CFX9_9ACTN|nr:hypothetical protein [Candidatus Olsenella excrementavium]